MKLRGPLSALLALVTAFIALLLWITTSRAERGDAYPAYSASRSDPLGTRILYDTLSQLPGIVVERNYTELERLRLEPGATLLLMRAHPGYEDWKAIDKIARRGTHVIVALPGTAYESNVLEVDTPFDEEDEEDSEVAEENEEESDKSEVTRRLDYHGFHIVKLQRIQDLIQVTGEGGFGPLPWRGNAAFDITGFEDRWTVLHIIHAKPVVIARDCGSGRVTVFADSYLFSNQAVADHAPVPLFVSLFEGSPHIVFDETARGLVETTGVSTLVRRHSLGGFFLMLVVVAGLQAWRSAQPPESFLRTRHDAAAAPPPDAPLHALLRRHVPRADLIPAALSLFRKDVARRATPEVRRRAKAARPDPALDPVTSYNNLRDTLSHGRKTHHHR